MKRFYERYSHSSPKLRQLFAVLPWGHNLLLLSKKKEDEPIAFYANEAVTKAPAPLLLPGFATSHTAEGIAEAEQFVEDAHEVLVVPGFVLQMPAHEVGYVVKEGFVGVGGVDRKQFEQGQELVLGMALQEVFELLAVGNGKKGGAFSGRGRRVLHRGQGVISGGDLFVGSGKGVIPLLHLLQ
jgi:hypothetical protein